VTPARTAAALALAVLATACGTPSADLFVVEREGELPDAELTLRVGDGGTVRCDGGPEKTIASGDLLDARGIAEELQPLLDRDLTLPPQPESLVRYRVTGESGEVRFADNSRGQPEAFGKLIAFTRKIAKSTCGLER